MNVKCTIKQQKLWMIAAFIFSLNGLQLFAQTTPQTILLERAVLNAATFSSGSTSGMQLGTNPVNGQRVPFFNRQPVQGFSGVLDAQNGNFYALADNGFGGIENSSDFNLRIYQIKPNFKTPRSGSGAIEVIRFIELRDPNKRIPFAITNEFTTDRILTGGDFDPESFQRVNDGSFWVGDEFGPFLLHFDANGILLEAPIALPDFENAGKELRAPQNPYNEEGSAIRIMNAVRNHARYYGNNRVPVFSPANNLLEDNNTATAVGDRTNPPAGSGLAAASSEIFNVASIKNAGYPVVPYTVNDTATMRALVRLGVNGIISDRPDLLFEVVSTYDGNNDGKPDFMDADGLIDVNRFDAQGHRGARNLRPENTLPAFEVALDNLMPTLETDCGITKDSIPVLDHDPHVEAAKTRRVDNSTYTLANEVLVKNLTLREIQTQFIADKLLTDRPTQTNDRSLSPVAVAFAQQQGLIDPYVMPSLQNLFDFVNFYIEYYKNGAGKTNANAEKRWKNAARVRFNLETKINPRSDRDARGDVFADRTVNADLFAKTVANVIVKNNLQQRADIQSFDFRTLLIVQENYPAIRTVYLFGDFPKVGTVGDGTNLQTENGKNTPWLAGLYWPYRSTRLTNPARVRGSGGFEGLAWDRHGRRLLALLEAPLSNVTTRELLIHEFNLDTKKYTGKRFTYPLNARGTNIGDFILFQRNKGLIIERDGTQGDLNGFKAIYEVSLPEGGGIVQKNLIVDLLNINDTNLISAGGQAGDIGLGKRFAFPFVTIESVIVFSNRVIGVLNDNNYPFSIGRHVGTRQPDDNEFIKIQLAQPLGSNRPSNITNPSPVNSNANKTESLNALMVENVFPNPTTGKVIVQFSQLPIEEATLTLLDVAGKTVQVTKVKTTQGISTELNMTNLSTGTYLLKVEAEGMAQQIVKINKQ